MRGSKALQGLPLPVRKGLEKLGADLSAARRRRKISMAVLAQRAFITRKTLGRVERGDAGVSIGIYATVLFVLGMGDRLANIADVSTDRLAQDLEREQLPKQVRRRSHQDPSSTIFLLSGTSPGGIERESPHVNARTRSSHQSRMVTFVFTNPRHHLEMMLPVARALRDSWRYESIRIDGGVARIRDTNLL